MASHKAPRHQFCQPIWQPTQAKGAAGRPQSAGVSRWSTSAAGDRTRRQRSLLRPTTPDANLAAAKQKSSASRIAAPRYNRPERDADQSGEAPIGHSICGSYAALAQPAGCGSDDSSAQSAGVRLDHLQRMMQHQFESQSGGHKLVPAFRRMTHSGREADPRLRRANPRDLASFLGDCGAYATESEAAHLVVNARAGQSSADGSFGIRTFHDIARGINAGGVGRAQSSRASKSRSDAPIDFGKTMVLPRPQSAGARSSRPQSSSCCRSGGSGKIGSKHWQGCE